jgi:hypothetical protein
VSQTFRLSSSLLTRSLPALLPSLLALPMSLLTFVNSSQTVQLRSHSLPRVRSPPFFSGLDCPITLYLPVC